MPEIKGIGASILIDGQALAEWDVNVVDENKVNCYISREANCPFQVKLWNNSGHAVNFVLFIDNTRVPDIYCGRERCHIHDGVDTSKRFIRPFLTTVAAHRVPKRKGFYTPPLAIIKFPYRDKTILQAAGKIPSVSQAESARNMPSQAETFLPGSSQRTEQPTSNSFRKHLRPPSPDEGGPSTQEKELRSSIDPPDKDMKPDIQKRRRSHTPDKVGPSTQVRKPKLKMARVSALPCEEVKPNIQKRPRLCPSDRAGPSFQEKKPVSKPAQVGASPDKEVKPNIQESDSSDDELALLKSQLDISMQQFNLLQKQLEKLEACKKAKKRAKGPSEAALPFASSSGIIDLTSD